MQIRFELWETEVLLFTVPSFLIKNLLLASEKIAEANIFSKFVFAVACTETKESSPNRKWSMNIKHSCTVIKLVQLFTKLQFLQTASHAKIAAYCSAVCKEKLSL